MPSGDRLVLKAMWLYAMNWSSLSLNVITYKVERIIATCRGTEVWGCTTITIIRVLVIPTHLSPCPSFLITVQEVSCSQVKCEHQLKCLLAFCIPCSLATEHVLPYLFSCHSHHVISPPSLPSPRSPLNCMQPAPCRFSSLPYLFSMSSTTKVQRGEKQSQGNRASWRPSPVKIQGQCNQIQLCRMNHT